MIVGFIGVGAMGQPMAEHVLANHDVVVFDLDTDRLSGLEASGATLATSARDVAERSDVIIVMVATPDQVQTVLFAPGGAAEGLSDSTAVVIMSSVGMACVLDVQARLAPRGIRVIDAPVTGGVVRALTAELTILVGATDEALDRVRPVLELMGSTIAHCGPAVGDGQAVKLVNQLLCAVHLAAAAEALNFAKALGLDPARVLATIEGGAAASFMLSDRGPRMLSEGEPPVLSSIDIFVKDSTLVREAARAVGASVPLATQASLRFDAARRAGFGAADDSSVIRVLEIPDPEAATP